MLNHHASTACSCFNVRVMVLVLLLINILSISPTFWGIVPPESLSYESAVQNMSFIHNFHPVTLCWWVLFVPFTGGSNSWLWDQCTVCLLDAELNSFRQAQVAFKQLVYKLQTTTLSRICFLPPPPTAYLSSPGRLTPDQLSEFVPPLCKHFGSIAPTELHL